MFVVCLTKGKFIIALKIFFFVMKSYFFFYHNFQRYNIIFEDEFLEELIKCKRFLIDFFFGFGMFMVNLKLSSFNIKKSFPKVLISFQQAQRLTLPYI